MSVRYSPIAPLPLLQQLNAHGVLGNYLLLLTHEVLKDPHGYSELVESLEDTEENPRFIIMDNGVIELNKPIEASALLDAANLVEADCIVTPDVIGDAAATKKLVMDQSSRLSRHYPLMRIPQGSCYTDILGCIDWLNSRLPPNGAPSYWGVPRWITNQLRSRGPVIEYILAICPTAKIHLLGMSQNLRDDQRCLRKHNIIGIDSANPIVMGLMNMKMRQGVWTHMDRGNYWDCTVLHTAAAENVEFMHDSLR